MKIALPVLRPLCPILALSLLLAAACGRPSPSDTNVPQAAAPAPQQADAAADTGPLPLEEVPGVSSEPANLTVNAPGPGPVFFNGIRQAISAPTGITEQNVGRRAVQVAFADGAELAAPANVLLRTGVSTVIYVRRQNRDARPLSDLDRIEVLSMVDAEGSGEGSGMSPGAGRWVPLEPWAGATAQLSLAADPVETGAGEGSSDSGEASGGSGGSGAGGSGAATAASGSGAPVAPPTLGSGAAASATNAALAAGEGSAGSGEMAPLAWTAIRIESNPPGQLYIDGLRSPLRTPVTLRMPMRAWSFQVMFDDGQLSRHVEPGLVAEVRRFLSLVGSDLLVIR